MFPFTSFLCGFLVLIPVVASEILLGTHWKAWYVGRRREGAIWWCSSAASTGMGLCGHLRPSLWGHSTSTAVVEGGRPAHGHGAEGAPPTCGVGPALPPGPDVPGLYACSPPHLFRPLFLCPAPRSLQRLLGA